MLTLVSLAALAVMGQGTLASTSRTLSPSPTPSFEEVCQQILTRAVELTEQNCDATGRNEACYGSNLVEVELQEGLDPASVRFEESGDIVPVRNLARIETKGMNPETGDWGLALVKLQANLPNTNPGQNVTFILYGNTRLSPAAGRTNAFYLSTELGELSCNNLPSSSLMVRAPGHVEVAFTLNDVEIRLASTLVLSATDSTLQVRVLEGHASVTAADETQTMVAGQELAVPLDAVTGNAVGAPGEPETFVHDPVTDTLGTLIDTLTGEALEGPFTLEGTIELIDLERGWITVDGRRIKLSPEELAGLEVGQQFTFSGYGHGFIAFELPPGLIIREGARLSPDMLDEILRALGLNVPNPRRVGLQSRTPRPTRTPRATFTPRPTRMPRPTFTPRPPDDNPGNQGNQGNQGRGQDK
jgi:hypothetical protein